MKIYICKVSELFESCTQKQIYDQIPQERRKSALACRNEADKKRSLAVSFLLWQCMREHHVPVDAVMDYTKGGKLFFPGREEFYVNLSHADDYAVCAYDREPVGVDVEGIRSYREAVVKRLASDEEKAFLLQQSTADGRDAAFSRWWTRKECAVKLTGRGIAGLEARNDKETAEIFIREFQPYEHCFVSVASFHNCFCETVTRVKV